VQVWAEISQYLARQLHTPARVLDAAAGRGEFINSVPAVERWAVDAVDFQELHADPEVTTVIGDILSLSLPNSYFDGVLVSNLLEHLPSQEVVGSFLTRMRELLASGGRIAVLGPNFRYCAREYFDCADHTLALTHVAVEEHLYAAGFHIESVEPRFLPYSFRGRLPTGRTAVRAYLRFRPAWRLLGKQFLVIASKDA
jgi:2-polyprenyl-3-methyl-5-hydroxy-6-metoxy-1,4-benzoquinol methylase